MSYGSSDNVTCDTICPVPADHSRKALGDLVAPCSLPIGHVGDHGNGLSVWENVGASLRADAERLDALDADVIAADDGDIEALKRVLDAIVSKDDQSHYAQTLRVAAFGEIQYARTFEQVEEAAHIEADKEMRELARIFGEAA